MLNEAIGINPFTVMTKEYTYYIQNFSHPCCLKWLKHVLEKSGIQVLAIDFGKVVVLSESTEEVEKIIKNEGFALIIDKNLQKVEAIKLAVFELVQLQSNQNSIIQKSEYLIEKLGMSHIQMSKLFSKYEPITLEKFIIKQKIEKIKQLIISDELTLSEIAYRMDYSSVQHLSMQFKKETGETFSEFKAQFSKNVDENEMV